MSFEVGDDSAGANGRRDNINHSLSTISLVTDSCTEDEDDELAK